MNPSFITLADCLIAYRKAKSEAFYENPHMQALAFADYEKRLLLNLRDLLQAIHSHRRPWSEDREWLGRWYYVPKSIRLPDQTNGDGVFYRCLDPLEEWRRQIAESGDRATVSFRLMIRPSVNLQMLSALWILKVGHLLDGALSKDLSYGNRLRRQPLSDWGYSGTDPGGINVDTPGLFRLYPYAYRQWRENGLSAMESALADNKRIVAITMDITKFYHRVNPDFVLREPFLAAIGVELSADQIAFSKQLLSAIRTWYRTTPDYRKHPGTALPVGLSASKVLANVLLADFDRGFVDRVKPLYYGRYVDDFFIVLSPEEGVDSGGGLMDFMARANPGVLTRVNTGSASGLRLTLPYAEDSELLFGAEKQKFFNLSGAYGLDLVAHISEQIRKQSSEHRFLPIVPETGQEMASRALLAQPEASLEVDAIRKADVISVRRLGFALLLRDMESYGRDLPPQSWRKRRGEFYDLISRHVVTPQGLFEFVRYMRRVFGLMVACRDYDAASDLVQRLQEVTTTLRETTTAGTTDRAEFISCMEYCAVTLIEAAIEATTVPRFKWSRKLLTLLVLIGKLSSRAHPPKTMLAAQRISVAIFHADFGRRPYREAWLNGAPSKARIPEVPGSRRLRHLLRFGAVKEFRHKAELRRPYWPALAFPTRPIGLNDITFHAPDLLHSPARLRAALFAFRGARVRTHEGMGLVRPQDASRAPELLIDTRSAATPRIGLPSLYTSPDDWEDALAGKSNLRLERLERFRRLINAMCRERPKPNYIVFPECSVPRDWAKGIAYRLAKQRISFVAGLEYSVSAKGVRNDAFISLTTEWPWYPASISYVQPKLEPSHEEKRALQEHGNKSLYRPKDPVMPVYVHGQFCFGVLICSDLTTLQNRQRLQGIVDALFVLEWNPDIETFAFLVEATAHDIHGYVVQVNNREYGDSRIRIPKKIPHERDVVRVRGGMADYYVIAELDYSTLRAFQRSPKFGKTAQYKPLPIGYIMSDRRRQSG